jgi:glutaryl-CoA dehydrogenase (non-decarboxylating)
MDFSLTDEQRMYRDLVRDFARREVAPHVVEYDREERYPTEIVKRAAELGLLGGVVPTEYGGGGLDYVTYAIGVEEMAKVCTTVASAMSRTSGLVGAAILQFGSEQHKRDYVGAMCRGEMLGATAVTEPHSGSDVAAMETTVRRDGGDYVINGSKIWISNLDSSDWFLTFATLDRSKGKDGICAFVVSADSPGLSYNVFKNKVGIRASSTGELVFQDVRVPVENLVGEEGRGLRVALSAVENGRLAVSARAVGLAQACLDGSIRYARERVVFGQEIGEYQLVKAKIAEMMVNVETARLLVYRLAWLRDQGVKRARLEAGMAKLHSTEIALKAAIEACQIFGAYSCSEDLPVGRFFRDAKFLQIVEGTNELQRLLIADYALGYRRDRS